MNAGAYGRDFAALLERALVVSPEGPAWLTADDVANTRSWPELRKLRKGAR